VLRTLADELDGLGGRWSPLRSHAAQ